jgi:DNA-directed RNA polymerase subunit M/transcription elongation factor TFIIS
MNQTKIKIDVNEIKRLYVINFRMKMRCPKCDTLLISEHDHIEYGFNGLYFHCDKCDEGYEKDFEIKEAVLLIEHSEDIKLDHKYELEQADGFHGADDENN